MKVIFLTGTFNFEATGSVVRNLFIAYNNLVNRGYTNDCAKLFFAKFVEVIVADLDVEVYVFVLFC